MVQKIFSVLLAFSFLTLFCAGLQAQTRVADDVEYKFAKGLAELGYHDLAADRFEVVRENLQPGTADYYIVTLDLADAYEGAVDIAVEPDEKLRYARLARAEIERLLGTELPEQRRNDLNVQYGKMLLRQGQLMTDVLARDPEGIDAEAIRTESRELLQRAMEAFEEASAGYEKIVAEVEEMARLTDEDRERRNYSLQQQVVTANEIGWINFRLAELYAETEEAELREQSLRRAVEIFEELSEEREDMVAGVSSTLGLGRALHDLGETEKAVEAYEKVLTTEARGDAQRSLVELQQFSLYYRAEALNDLENFEQAIRSLNSLYELKRQHPEVHGVEMDAVIMELGRTYARHAESLERQATQKEEEGEADVAAALREQSRSRFKQAADAVSGLAQRPGPYSRPALRNMGEWLAKSGEDVQDSSAGWFAEGERLFDAKEFIEAADAYRRAIAAAGDSREERKIQQDSWLRMGQAYATAERFYEAGLALGQAARLYPGEWFAENAAQHSSILLGAVYQQGGTPFESDAYIDAQQFLVENFPDNAVAQRAAVRLGDLQRNRGRYLEAAKAYEQVPRESPFYERAQFLAGESLWNAYQAGAATDEAEGEDFIDRAVNRLLELVRYAREEPVAGAEQRQVRNLYSGRAKLRLARIYMSPERMSPQNALDILDDFSNLHSGHQQLIPEALVLRIQAYTIAENPEGGEGDLNALLRDFPDYEDNAMVARMLGESFIDLALDMREQGAEDPEKADHYIAKGGDYLLKSIDLQPDQTFDDFSQIASRLYQAEIYDGAARTFNLAAERFGDRPEFEEQVLAAREWEARCYMQTGEWRKAVDLFDDIVEQRPRVMAVRRRLAISLENLDTEQAGRRSLEQWRVVERTLRQGSNDWFEARFHIAKNQAQLGSEDNAYQTISTTAIAYPNLGGENWREQFIDLVENDFRDGEYKKKFQELLEEQEG